MVQGAETGHQVVEVGSGVIFHSKVVDYKYKCNVAGDMAEKTGGSGFIETEGRKKADYPKITEFTRFF